MEDPEGSAIVFKLLYEGGNKDGLVGHVRATVTGMNVVPVLEAACAGFKTGQVIVFLNPITGLKMAGPVTVKTYDIFSERLLVSSSVTVEKGDAIYISGKQDEVGPPRVT
jgi:hypothetical protein